MPERLSSPLAEYSASVRRRSALLCAATAIAILLAACGSSDDPSGAADTTPGSASDASDCVDAAMANVQAGQAPMEINPLGPFDTSASAGKTFAMIQFSREGNAVEIANAEALTAALENVGADVVIFDGEGRADVLLQAFDSAIAQGVAGIVADGFDMELVKAGVAAAQEADIPVLDVGAGSTEQVEPSGVSAFVAVDGFNVGKLQASYALAQTNCQLRAVTMPVSGAPITVNMASGAAAEVEKLCPTDCSIEELEVDPATFITEMAGQVQTTLQRTPDINYWITTADFFTPFITQGMEAVDRQLPIVGGAQGDGLTDAIAGDNALVATTLWPPATIMGYIYADGIMRAVAGVPENQVTPVRLVDPSNWGKNASEAEQFPDLVEWQESFKAAWGA